MKEDSIAAWVNEKWKFCINIFAILKLNVEARVTRFVSSYRSFDASQPPPFPPLEETTRKWMELRYVARVKGIPDNTFFVNFFFLCTYGEDLDFFFFSLSLFYFCLFEILFERIYLFRISFFKIVIIQSVKKQSFCFNINLIFSWQETSLYSSWFGWW